MLLVRLLLLVYLALVLTQLAGPPRWSAVARSVVVYVVYTAAALVAVGLVVSLQGYFLG